MKLKRFIASIVATALVGTTFAMTSALDASAVASSYTATLQGQLVDQGFWDNDASSVTVSGDGDYTLSLTYTGEDAEVTTDSCCLILTLDFNVYDVSSSGSLDETGIKINISSVDCDGTSLNYSGSTSNDKTYRVNDDGKHIRLNIFNQWSPGQETADISLPFSVTNGSKVNVKFSISGLDDAIHKAKVLAGEEEETEATTATETTEAKTDANATESATEATSEGDTTTTSADTTTTSGDTTTTTSADTTSADTTTTTTSKSNSTNDSNSNDSNDDSDGVATEVAKEETANATSDTGVASVVLVCALASAGIVATRKRD